MKKISDWNCPWHKQILLKTSVLVKTYRIFSKKSHLSRKNTLRKIINDNFIAYKYNNISNISKISDCSNQYNRHKRITSEAVITRKCISLKVYYKGDLLEEN